MKTQLKKNCGRWLMTKNGNNKAIMDEEMVWLTGFIVYSTSRRPRETYIVSNLCFGLTAWVFDWVYYDVWRGVRFQSSGNAMKAGSVLDVKYRWSGMRSGLVPDTLWPVHKPPGSEWQPPITSASESFESAFKWLYPG